MSAWGLALSQLRNVDAPAGPVAHEHRREILLMQARAKIKGSADGRVRLSSIVQAMGGRAYWVRDQLLLCGEFTISRDYGHGSAWVSFADERGRS